MPRWWDAVRWRSRVLVRETSSLMNRQMNVCISRTTTLPSHTSSPVSSTLCTEQPRRHAVAQQTSTMRQRKAYSHKWGPYKLPSTSRCGRAIWEMDAYNHDWPQTSGPRLRKPWGYGQVLPSFVATMRKWHGDGDSLIGGMWRIESYSPFLYAIPGFLSLKIQERPPVTSLFMKYKEFMQEKTMLKLHKACKISVPSDEATELPYWGDRTLVLELTFYQLIYVMWTHQILLYPSRLSIMVAGHKETIGCKNRDSALEQFYNILSDLRQKIFVLILLKWDMFPYWPPQALMPTS